MELSNDFIQENGLSDEQVSKINEFVGVHLSELKNEWNGKANKDAEGILDGASNYAMKTMGLEGVERLKGEKYGDFLMRTTPMFVDSALAKEKSNLAQREKQLDDKLKNTNGNEVLLQELESVKGKLSALKEKEAKYSEWEENDYKGKYQESTNELESLRVNMAFNSVKPKFPDTVNEYEANYKWEQFKKGILDNNHIKIVDNEAFVVDKENEFKTQKLSDVLKKDQEIALLLKGENRGLGGKTKTVRFKDVPFEVQENATPQDRTRSIKEYLTSQGLQITSPEYAKRFAELNSKILSQKTA